MVIVVFKSDSFKSDSEMVVPDVFSATLARFRFRSLPALPMFSDLIQNAQKSRFFSGSGTFLLGTFLEQELWLNIRSGTITKVPVPRL